MFSWCRLVSSSKPFTSFSKIIRHSVTLASMFLQYYCNKLRYISYLNELCVDVSRAIKRGIAGDLSISRARFGKFISPIVNIITCNSILPWSKLSMYLFSWHIIPLRPNFRVNVTVRSHFNFVSVRAVSHCVATCLRVVHRSSVFVTRVREWSRKCLFVRLLTWLSVMCGTAMYLFHHACNVIVERILLWPFCGCIGPSSS